MKSIIIPAIEELKEEGYKVSLKTADRKNGVIKQEDMPNYYKELELYVCASKTEGTPLPVLEAMACGVPIVSTDVGIVKEALGNEQSNYILSERSKEKLKNKKKDLCENSQKLKILSKENLEQIKKWSWENIAIQYKEFFENNL